MNIPSISHPRKSSVLWQKTGTQKGDELNCAAREIHMLEVLIPGTSECDSIWKRGL